MVYPIFPIVKLELFAPTYICIYIYTVTMGHHLYLSLYSNIQKDLRILDQDDAFLN